MSHCVYMWFSKQVGLAVRVCVYIRLCASLYTLYMYMYMYMYIIVAYCFFLLLSQAVSSFTIHMLYRVLYNMFVGICIKPSAR